jgi:hypothetical protein
MKITPAITSVLVSLLSLAEVRSHGISTRHCITNDGNLRIFIEHYHGTLASPGSAGTMQIKNLYSGITSTLSATGIINTVDLSVSGKRPMPRDLTSARERRDTKTLVIAGVILI